MRPVSPRRGFPGIVDGKDLALGPAFTASMKAKTLRWRFFSITSGSGKFCLFQETNKSTLPQRACWELRRAAVHHTSPRLGGVLLVSLPHLTPTDTPPLAGATLLTHKAGRAAFCSTLTHCPHSGHSNTHVHSNILTTAEGGHSPCPSTDDGETKCGPSLEWNVIQP